MPTRGSKEGRGHTLGLGGWNSCGRATPGRQVYGVALLGQCSSQINSRQYLLPNLLPPSEGALT